MMASEKAYKLIKEFEGLKLKSYRDYAGIWTIGYGHTRTAGPNQKITEEEAEELLKSDVEIVEAAINSMVRVPLTQNQFDALVSLVYNIGIENFRRSILLMKLNAGLYNQAAKEFLKWTKAKDPQTGNYVVLPGLLRRRKKEMDLFNAK